MAARISRVALVTGSGKKRIGWHVADALAGHGHATAVHCRTSAKEAAYTVEHPCGRGVEVVVFQADLADESAVSGLFQAVWNQFGRLDVLVNCAAVYQAKRLEKRHRGGRPPEGKDRHGRQLQSIPKSLHGHFPQSAAAAIAPAAVSRDQQLSSTPKHAHRRWRGRGDARIGHRLDLLRRRRGGVGGGLLMLMVGLIRQMMAKLS